jgi:hypothetical protein
MTLDRFQYQLGDFVFGRNTNIPISKCDIQPYNVNNQDFQIPLTDENRFGIDTLVPGTIVFTMAVVENYVLPQYANQLPHDFNPDDLFAMRGTVVGGLANTWKAKSTRMFWGATVPLLHKTFNDEVLRIYGRPGKFQYAPRYNDNTQWIDIQAEFRRIDTYAHSDLEFYAPDPVNPANGLAPGAAPVTVERGDGDADSWVRVLINGPCTHPLITYGDNVIELDLTIDDGVALEVSSYPWARRVVDTNNINWRSQVIGATQYLSDIVFPVDSSLDISWTCTGTTNSNTQMYFLWREAYNIL